MPEHMSTPQILSILGLILNTAAAIILIIPNINPTKNLDDDLVFGKPGDREYTQVKYIKESCINKIGLILLAIGFILQLIAAFF